MKYFDSNDKKVIADYIRKECEIELYKENESIRDTSFIDEVDNKKQVERNAKRKIYNFKIKSY